MSVPQEYEVVVKLEWFRRIYRMPIAVFVIGLLSIVMFLWISRISQEERVNFAICDALMDIQ
jgi:hypothetical protein